MSHYTGEKTANIYGSGNDFKAIMFSMSTLNIQDSKNKSGIQTDHQDTHKNKKQYAVQYNDYHFIGNLSSEVSIFKRCLPNNNQPGLKTDSYHQNHTFIQNEKHDFSGEPNSEVSSDNQKQRCLSCFKRINPLNLTNGSNANTDLEEDRMHFKFHVRLTSEVMIYKRVINSNGPAGGVSKNMRKKLIDAKNSYSIKKRFGKRKNTVSTKKRVYKCFKKSGYNLRILSLGSVNRNDNDVKSLKKRQNSDQNTGK